MVIDRERVKQAFQEYTGTYDIHDEKIRLKVEHTYRVADISEQIAEKLGLSEEDIALAWLIGMLHDIGRFEQLRRFHTFVDSQSIMHILVWNCYFRTDYWHALWITLVKMKS